MKPLLFRVSKIHTTMVYGDDCTRTVILDPISAPGYISSHSPITLVFGIEGVPLEDGTKYEVGQKWELVKQ